MRELRVRVREADRERAVDLLLLLHPAGLEERDAVDRAGAPVADLVLYGEGSALPSAERVRAALGAHVLELERRAVPDDWEERWKAFHRPVRVGPVGVRPPWEPPDPLAEVDVVVDPGQAFGTGAHPTTRLCLELLLAHGGPWRGGALADWGAGSGVLAVAAAKLGYAPVAAVDVDPRCVAASEANARANGVALDVAQVDLLAAGPGAARAPHAPVVCANLLRPLLLDVAARLRAVPELLVVSGLLAGEGDEVAAAFAAHGLRERDRRREGEWVALALALVAPPPRG